jgi:hypothetical protein
MYRHTHNTRLTPEKPKHGGPRQGAGRPDNKENVNLNVTDTTSVARQYRHTEVKHKEEYQQQQDELVNPKGRSWSYHECTLILTLILAVIVHYGQTPTDALHTVSAFTRRSYYCVHALWVKWRDEKEVYVVDTDNRGGGASCHVNHSHHVSVDVILTIIDYIRNTNSTGGGCTTTGIQDQVLAQHNITIHSRTLHNILSSLGYRYGKVNVIGKMNDSWYVARIRTFLIQYNKALIEEQKGQRVIVYTDESYVNTSHARGYSWFNPDTEEKNNVIRPGGRGRRLVLLHAFTKDGWLAHNQSIHNDRCDQKALSCELIYVAEKGDGDYHANMNGSIYMQWLHNRLIPTFKKLYPRKKMVLVLDNASYHHVRGDDWINIHTMNKTEIAYKLIELGVNSISVQRQKKGTRTMETKTFPKPSFYEVGSKWAPTLDELKKELKTYLDTHPGINQTQVQKLFKQHGHELIYTPPYQPGAQPIERLWAYAKNYVASQYQTGRTMSELLDQTYKGFYGDGQQHTGVNQALCTSVINHSKEYCNYLIDVDDELDGTILDLKTESAAEVTDIVADIEADMDPFPGVVEEQEERLSTDRR